MKNHNNLSNLKQTGSKVINSKTEPGQKKRQKLKGKFAPEYILTPLPKSEF